MKRRTFLTGSATSWLHYLRSQFWRITTPLLMIHQRLAIWQRLPPACARNS